MFERIVDCLGERLTCVPKSSGFWNPFWYNIMVKTCNIPWGTSYSWATTWDASMNFTSLYHYIIRKCFSKSWTFWDSSQSFSQQSNLGKAQFRLTIITQSYTRALPTSLKSCTLCPLDHETCTASHSCYVRTFPRLHLLRLWTPNIWQFMNFPPHFFRLV
jgi:hypothetical protein